MGGGVTAFSTMRQGGYSRGNYGEFNINRYCGDEQDAIRKNREALCHLLGITDDHLLMPHQVHLTETAVVDETFLCKTAEERQQALEGVDALMTDRKGVCIGVSTADCIPILLYDPVHHAVCAIHAGWRGTVKRITEQAVKKMTATYGSRPADMIAQIGPGISLDSFEVSMKPSSKRGSPWSRLAGETKSGISICLNVIVSNSYPQGFLTVKSALLLSAPSSSQTSSFRPVGWASTLVVFSLPSSYIHNI